MVNPYRGEVSLCVNGEDLLLRLNLGSLAELEARLGEDGLLPMIERFETGAFKSTDLIALLTAGLRGAGWDGTEADLRDATLATGPIGAAKCAAELLRVTFSLPEQSH